MRIISTTGYYASGSSAVTDLLREYDTVTEAGGCDYEISFFFGYHGVLNLYNWLLIHKYNQRDAIIDYWNDACKKAHFGTKMNYEKYFNGHFLSETRKYLDSIRGEQIGERWYVDYMRLSEIQVFLNRVINKAYSIKNEIYNKTHTDRRETSIPVFGKKDKRYTYEISEDEFVEKTRLYFQTLFDFINDGKDIVMVDGLASSYALDEISRFFDDFRLTIVDRDPRDIYLTDKYVLQTENVPRDIRMFCEWYRFRHSCFTYREAKVLKVQFEDMIYRYDDTVKLIEEFVGVKDYDHVAKKEYFQPERSIKNTKLWHKYPSEEDNMRYIERNLSEWIYDYDKV